MAVKTEIAAINLPTGIAVADTKYPYCTKHPAPKGWYEKNRVVQEMQFYKTDRFGWVICTLHIRNASRRSVHQDTARFYGINLNGEICTVGLGPHVKEKFTLYVTQQRAADLAKYVDLFNKGFNAANGIRDRISSRRANTIARRTSLGW